METHQLNIQKLLPTNIRNSPGRRRRDANNKP